MQYKTLPAALTADLVGRRITGLAARFEPYVDLQDDKIARTAFDVSIASKPATEMPLLWQHNTSEVIGKLTSLRTTSAGLEFSALISLSSRGKDVLALLSDSTPLGVSIGFDAVKSSGHSPRRLEQIKLYELSIVTFAAQEGTGITSLKGHASATEVARLELQAKLASVGFEDPNTPEKIATARAALEQSHIELRADLLVELAALEGATLDDKRRDGESEAEYRRRIAEHERRRAREMASLRALIASL